MVPQHSEWRESYMRMRFGVGIILFVVAAVVAGPWILDSSEPPGKTLQADDISLTGSASVNGNLVVDGITGRSTVQGFSWDMTSTPGSTSGGGGASAGTTTFGPLTVTKAVDVRSLVLADAAASGKHFPTATLRIFRPGTQEVSLTYLLSDVVITKFRHSGGARAIEEVSFTYRTIEVTFAPPTGEPVRFCWDIATNARC